MAKRQALGEGMDILLGTRKASSAKPSGPKKSDTDATEIDINLVSPNKNQPRKKFDEDALEELSESIRQHGVIEPLVVTERTAGKKKYYQIIAGERRWRAARIAGLKKVPAVIKEMSDDQILEIALIENIQREDLNPIEEANAYSTLIKTLHLTQDQLAEKVSKSRAAITNSLRLLKLSSRVQQMVIDDKLSAGHVRALLGIEDKNKQYEAAQQVFDRQLSVRETEKLVKKIKEGDAPRKPAPESQVDLEYKKKQNELTSALKTKVEVKNKGNKGKIIISYNDLDEFERLYEMITK